jgi:hypothetical protein
LPDQPLIVVPVRESLMGISGNRKPKK